MNISVQPTEVSGCSKACGVRRKLAHHGSSLLRLVTPEWSMERYWWESSLVGELYATLYCQHQRDSDFKWTRGVEAILTFHQCVGKSLKTSVHKLNHNFLQEGKLKWTRSKVHPLVNLLLGQTGLHTTGHVMAVYTSLLRLDDESTSPRRVGSAKSPLITVTSLCQP